MALLEDAGPTAHWALAGALRSLADVVAADGRAEEAQTLHERARELEGLPVPEDPSMQRADRGDALLGRGLSLADAGDLEGAATTLRGRKISRRGR